MLSLQSPLEAYRSDLQRRPSKSEFGGADTVWLLMTHCLGRISRVSESLRDQIAAQCAAALQDLLESSCDEPAPDAADISDLRELIFGLLELNSRQGADSIGRAVRSFSSRMSDAGALSTAFTAVGHAREVVVSASDRERGLLAAEQGRVARLLGDLDTAETLYEACAAVAQRSGDTECLARAALGRGVVARVRGNYPRARILFERTLELTAKADVPAVRRLAHQGLTITAAAASDLDSALTHAWEAYRLSTGNATMEAETLTNLAQLSLMAGFDEAALRGFQAALARTPAVRVRLSALGGAALAAGRLSNPLFVERLAREIDQASETSDMPYENAQAAHHLARAFAELGNVSRCTEYRERTKRLAEAGGFYELAFASDGEELAQVGKESSRPRELQPPTLEVIDALASMEVVAVG
jgi:tetratricopeptide (TPR) repeat protein